jgi:hypothetical protein
MRGYQTPPPNKLLVYLWCIGVFAFAVSADLCFHSNLYILGLTSVVATVISICYSVVLLNRILNI